MSTNIPLLIYDLVLLPLQIVRLIIIYYWGSKYNLKGFTFLDVIMHADKPYFNHDSNNTINTESEDYRCTVRDDSRLCPLDVKKYLVIHNKQKNVSDSDTDGETEHTSTHNNILDSIRNELNNM